MAKRHTTSVAPPVPAQLRRCRVIVSILAPAYDYGRTLGPGALVDLDEPVAPGVTLRDLVRDDWFDPPSQAVSSQDAHTDHPAGTSGESRPPALSEEHDHGA